MSFESRNLNRSKFPTRRNIIEFLIFLRREKIGRGASQHTSYSKFIPNVAREIRELWRVKSIPLTSMSTTTKYVNEILNGYKKVIKNPHTLNEEYWDSVLILSHCKCGIERGNSCTCEEENKIPSHSKNFYIDQCGPRLRSFSDDSQSDADGESDDDVESDGDNRMEVDENAGELHDDDVYEDLDFGDQGDVMDDESGMDLQAMSDDDDDIEEVQEDDEVQEVPVEAQQHQGQPQEANQGAQPQSGPSRGIFALPFPPFAAAPKNRRYFSGSSVASRMSTMTSASADWQPTGSEVGEYAKSQAQLGNVYGDEPPKSVRQLHLKY